MFPGAVGESDSYPRTIISFSNILNLQEVASLTITKSTRTILVTKRWAKRPKSSSRTTTKREDSTMN